MLFQIIWRSSKEITHSTCHLRIVFLWLFFNLRYFEGRKVFACLWKLSSAMFRLRLNVYVWVYFWGEFGLLMSRFFIILGMIVLVPLNLLFHLIWLLLTVFSHDFVKIWCFLFFLWFLLIYWVFNLIWRLFSSRSTVKLILIEHAWKFLGHLVIPCYIHGRVLITLMLI